VKRTRAELDRWADLSAHQPATNQATSNGHPRPAEELPANVRRLPATTPTSPKLDELFDALGGYLHLDDPRPALFGLAVAISAQLDGPPLWGMIIGASSGGKTETLHMVDRLADERVSELTAASLLSWTKGKDPRETGILPRVGARGFVTVGDFSTVLATSDRGGRDQLFALLRCVYDGQVSRDLGNAPRALRWQGRITFLAACTPAIDHYSSHADALGPRWLYWRLPDRDAATKTATGRKAVHAAQLATQRTKVAQLASQVVTEATPIAKTIVVDDELAYGLVDVAVAAGYGRAAVPRNGYGRREIEGMAVVEDPPRLVGQLMLLARGLLALGLGRVEVLAMCTQAALCSIPQQRLAVLQVLARADEAELGVSEIARRAGCSREVARFALEELECVGVTRGPDHDDGDRTVGGFPTPSLWRLEGDNAGLVRSVLDAALALDGKCGFPSSNFQPTTP
jgi:hypothetical protein